MLNYLRPLDVGVRKLFEMPANLGSRVVALPPVASRLEGFYEKRQREHAGHLAPLDAADAEIVWDLKRTGVSVTSIEALQIPGTAEVLSAADELMGRHLPLRRSFQSGDPDIMAFPSIFRWGLQDRLLNIAENYLGLPVGYDGINIFFTKADGRESGARRWHRDVEDRRMLKVALYVHDVDLGGGPLQVLTRRLPDHDRTRAGTFPILTQQMLEGAFGDFDAARDIVTCTGKRGTVVFADTATFYHRGMPATTRDRCAIYSTTCTGPHCGRSVANGRPCRAPGCGISWRTCRTTSGAAPCGATACRLLGGSCRRRRSGSRPGVAPRSSGANRPSASLPISSHSRSRSPRP